MHGVLIFLSPSPRPRPVLRTVLKLGHTQRLVHETIVRITGRGLFFYVIKLLFILVVLLVRFVVRDLRTTHS